MTVQTWQIGVMTPDGRYDVGTYSLGGGVTLPPERIANALAEIAWRITADLAQPKETEGEDEPRGT
jgi:hypothetical protein